MGEIPVCPPPSNSTAAVHVCDKDMWTSDCALDNLLSADLLCRSILQDLLPILVSSDDDALLRNDVIRSAYPCIHVSLSTSGLILIGGGSLALLFLSLTSCVCEQKQPCLCFLCE